MVNLTEKAKRWPRRKNGQPIFKTTDQAIFYAHLIANNKRLADEIDHYRHLARQQLKAEREKTDPNYNLLMEIALKGQLFRECLDEVKRIQKDL